MKKRILFWFGITAALPAIALGFGGCDNLMNALSTPAAYTVTANGGANTTTTALTFEFSEAAAGLAAGDIAITSGTGDVTEGALAGGGNTWTLGVAVNTPGTITVAIAKTGIEAGAKTVMVHKQSLSPSGIAYTVTANGNADTTTTALTFAFSGAVAGLAAENIILTNGTGNITKGALTGGGNTWTLALVVSTPGNITVAIAKDGIEAAAKTVTVYKQSQLPSGIAYTVTANGDANTTTTALTFVFSEAVADLAAHEIIVGGVVKGGLAKGSNSKFKTF
ncbi:MAG: hypothetical protein LBU16_09125 [Treponema sp.]|jgi:hypothetical protein|nr:hypothetical protein [Treponema sp.]